MFCSCVYSTQNFRTQPTMFKSGRDKSPANPLSRVIESPGEGGQQRPSRVGMCGMPMRNNTRGLVQFFALISNDCSCWSFEEAFCGGPTFQRKPFLVRVSPRGEGRHVAIWCVCE